MKQKGIEAFDQHYEQEFGERWQTLRGALLGPARQVARLNAFANREAALGAVANLEPVPGLANCFLLDEPLEPGMDENGLRLYYRMDLASVLCAEALGVQRGERVLDLCAAPGGKALILAEKLAEDGELIANEMSEARRSRLLRVFREYLPESVRDRIRVTGHDGTQWCLHERDAYDRILVDAPCSGERHLLEAPNEMREWSRARTKNLSVRQYALLASAFLAVKPGGCIVYSTCSISRAENDGIIEKLVKKKKTGVEVVGGADGDSSLAGLSNVGEPSRWGTWILPDRTELGGEWGPIFFARIRRLAEASADAD